MKPLISTVVLAASFSALSVAHAGAPTPALGLNVAGAKGPATERCAGVTLGRREGPVPFRDGEELAYELSVAGLDVGRFETKVGKPRVIDGKRWLSLFGRARTSSFASSFKSFAGRYMSLVEPTSMKPAGARVEATYGEDPRWEKVRFLEDSTRVDAKFLYNGKQGSREYDKDAPLTDVLTMIYMARTRDLSLGGEVCQDVFGARWLWRMHAKVDGVVNINTPAGKKAAYKVATRFERAPHPDLHPSNQQKVEMDIYFAQDASQVPLRFDIRTDKFDAEGKLVRWSLDDQGETEWAF